CTRPGAGRTPRSPLASGSRAAPRARGGDRAALRHLRRGWRPSRTTTALGRKNFNGQNVRMAESNPMRWVVLSLVAAAATGLGICGGVEAQVAAARAKAAAEARAMEQRMEARDRVATAGLEAARQVAAR